MSKKKLVLTISFSAVLILILVFSIVIPTFSRFQNGLDNPEWNGVAANSFKSGTGTAQDPYIISTPNEFAYFALSLDNEDYNGKYIKLTKDLVINKGVFKDNTYIYNDVTYYLNNNGKYYLEDTYTTEVGSIKVFPIIEGFKGTFDGDFHTIYGLYEKDNNKNALFTDFSGELKNLYLDNTYIKGGNITAGVISNAKDATIKNVLFNGTVIGNNSVNETTKSIEVEDFTVTDTLTKVINIPIISNISENILKGTCTGTDTFTLNNTVYTCSSFEIETSNTLEIVVSNTTSFSNITYELTFEENKSSGIVALADNTTIEGAINKGNITGIYTSGIAGTTLNSNITNSYNTGKLNGTRTSGIVDTVMYSNSYIRNSYNNGDLLTGTKSGLISKVYYSTIIVDKVFNTYNANMINNNISSTITVQDSYNVRNYTNNDYDVLDYEEISALYPKYIDNENISNGNIWVGEEIPILYFEDIKNRSVQIKIGNRTWDSPKQELQDVKYNDEIEVLVTTTDMYRPIKNVWYCASNLVLSNEDLTTAQWTEYNGIFRLDDNVYVLYIKYEDYNDNVYYINTDKLIIGDVRTNVNIKSGTTLWSTLHNPTNKFFNDSMSYEIIDNGTSLIISRIDYLVTVDAMTQEELANANWTRYNGNTITPSGDTYMIYVKVTDIDTNVVYLNTDRMINMAYDISNLKSGNNLTFSNYMSYNSLFNFNVSLNHRVTIPNYQRYIKVDKQLPNNTKITLKATNGSYYEYIVSTHTYDSGLNSYLYPFSGFKKVGKITFDEYFDNSDYNGISNESFSIYVDFKNITNLTNNYTLSVIAKSSEVINTLSGDEITLNLVNTNTNTLSITSNYDETIYYGTEETYNIPLNISLPATVSNNNTIVNTNFENLFEGISIEVYDGEDNIVSRDELENIRFKYNNTTYVFDTNNRVNINLGSNHTQNITLQALTSNGNTDIDDTYTIKIKGYLSIDGINKKYISSNVVEIPIVFEPKEDAEYSFDVSVSEPIINKGGNFSFNISYTGDLEDPHLRVSLYQKEELTAYDQEYELVDLSDYVSNNLDELEDSIYEIDIEDIVFNIKNNVETNGYKFVFELYDGDKKITESTIKTIIR